MKASTKRARTAARTIAAITSPPGSRTGQRASGPRQTGSPAAGPRRTGSPAAGSFRPRLLPRRRLRPTPAQLAAQPFDRVPMGVGHPLLERNDRVVGDVDVLGADLGAALGDVAVAEPTLVAEQIAAIEDVLGVHLQARPPEKRRA